MTIPPKIHIWCMVAVFAAPPPFTLLCYRSSTENGRPSTSLHVDGNRGAPLMPLEHHIQTVANNLERHLWVTAVVDALRKILSHNQMMALGVLEALI